MQQLRVLTVLMLTLLYGAGCGGGSKAAMEKERANQYFSKFDEIMAGNQPGAGEKSAEAGLKAMAAIEAIPTDGVPADVVANCRDWANFIKRGTESVKQGELKNDVLQAWKTEAAALDATTRNLRAKYK